MHSNRLKRIPRLYPRVVALRDRSNPEALRQVDEIEETEEDELPEPPEPPWSVFDAHVWLRL